MKKKTTEQKMIKATLNSIRSIRRTNLRTTKQLDEMIEELKLYGYITK